MQSNDVKDKSILMENRRLIETQMERFKASEKELKTKAFSKEGLIAASKVDPAERAKMELSSWLSNQVDELARQVETTEAEIEQIIGGAKKKKSGSASERAAQLDQLNDRRKWHSSRLEILLRMLENGSLDPDRINDIKEDISYFVESNAEEDFDEDDGIYDEFNLDDEEEAFGLKETDDMVSHDAASQPDDSISSATKPLPPKEAKPVKKEAEESKPEEKSRKASLTSTTSVTRKTSTSETAAKDAKSIPQANFTQAKPSTSAPASGPPVSSPVKASATSSLPPIRYAAAAAAAVSPTTTAAVTSPVSSTTARPAADAQAALTSPQPAPGASEAVNGASAVVATQSPTPSQAQPSSASVSSTPAQEHAKAAQRVDSQEDALGGQPVSPGAGRVGAGPPGLRANGAIASSPGHHDESAEPGLTTTAGADGASEAPGSDVAFQPAQLAASSAAAGLVQPVGGGAGTEIQQEAAQRQQGTDPRLPNSLADLVSSFESAKQNSLRRDADLDQLHRSLESNFMNVPEPQDSDKPKYYVPQNPFPTPAWYPQTPAPVFDNPAVYAKFDEDTLFYIFYYSQRDYHRYLAARELKKQSWRFSIRYGTWFRRHSEPVTINEDYEEGS